MFDTLYTNNNWKNNNLLAILVTEHVKISIDINNFCSREVDAVSRESPLTDSEMSIFTLEDVHCPYMAEEKRELSERTLF